MHPTKIKFIWFQQDARNCPHSKSIHAGHSWNVSGACYLSAYMAYGLHICLIFLPVIIFFGYSSKWTTDQWPQDHNLEVNFSNTRNHGKARSGKSASKFRRVCMELWATFYWHAVQNEVHRGIMKNGEISTHHFHQDSWKKYVYRKMMQGAT
jgi:hypothetical protein